MPTTPENDTTKIKKRRKRIRRSDDPAKAEMDDMLTNAQAEADEEASTSDDDLTSGDILLHRQDNDPPAEDSDVGAASPDSDDSVKEAATAAILRVLNAADEKNTEAADGEVVLRSSVTTPEFWKDCAMSCCKNPVSWIAIALVGIVFFVAGGCGEGDLKGKVTAADVSADGRTLTIETDSGSGRMVMPANLHVKITSEQEERIHEEELKVAREEAVLEFYQAQQEALEKTIAQRSELLQAARSRANERTRQVLSEATGGPVTLTSN